MARTSSRSTLLTKFAKRIAGAPSPRAAQNHLVRLVEVDSAKALSRVPAADVPHLFRSLGSRGFLTDVLIRAGASWPELFVRQIRTERKSVDDHLMELRQAIRQCSDFDEFCAVLRRHKQRE